MDKARYLCYHYAVQGVHWGGPNTGKKLVKVALPGFFIPLQHSSQKIDWMMYRGGA